MDLMSSDEAWLLVKSLSETLKRGSRPQLVTPLLVKFLIDDAIETVRSSGAIKALGNTMAEAVAGYVRRLAAREASLSEVNTEDQVIGAARVLGMLSLSGDYVPRAFYSDAAHRELSARFGPNADAIFDSLTKSGLLDKSSFAGTTKLRFGLDPVAEYLAAFFWLDRLRNDSDQWTDWTDGLQKVQGYPAGIQGFLSAVTECCVRYRSHFNVPFKHLPWDAQ
jgi:hypothetical protein